MAEHNDIGKWGEEVAAMFLQDKGYRIVGRDWRVGHRDIDIIAIDGDELVIVEVKTRTDDSVTRPEQAVTVQKMRSLCSAANAFVKTNRVHLRLRFDIVAVTGSPEHKCSINHIVNAFNVVHCMQRTPGRRKEGV